MTVSEMMRLLPPILSLVALVLTVGCGGGGGDDDDPPVPTITATPLAAPTATAAAVAFASGVRQLLRSDDGGTTWQANRFAGGNTLAFVDRDNGWLVGGTILRTRDGVTFEDQGDHVAGLPPVLIDVAAIDRDRAVAVGSANRIADPDPLRFGPPVVIVTSDGGTTWRHATLDGVTGPQFIDVRLTSVCLDPSGIGAALGFDLQSFTSNLILVTRDAGESWQVTMADAPLAVRVGCAAHSLWLMGSASTLLTSSDGGVSWQDRSATIPPDRFVFDVTFVDDRIGWLLAADQPDAALVVLRTDDGGASWHETLVDADIEASGASIAFVDPQHGIAVATDSRPSDLPPLNVGVTYATTDGGVSWTTTVHPSTAGLADVAFVR